MKTENALDKTNRMNGLFDFYYGLLTEKQQMILKYYFHDNYSLAEIAEELQISRQGVYEHIKRAEIALEDYEAKLRLLVQHEQRLKWLNELEHQLEKDPTDPRVRKWIEMLRQ